MAELRVPALVEGGKATAGPPLGPSLAPTGVNIGEVIAKINEATKDFAGMQVPVTVKVDTATKTFDIEVGTPPVSALIKKELGITEPVKEEAGVKGKPDVGDLSVDQAVKIAKNKQEACLGSGLKEVVKEVAGTCLSLGVKVDGKPAKQFIKDVDAGRYDAQLSG